MRRIILECSLILVIANLYICYASDFNEEAFWEQIESEQEYQDLDGNVVVPLASSSNTISKKRLRSQTAERLAKKSRYEPISKASDENDKSYDNQSEDALEVLSQGWCPEFVEIKHIDRIRTC